MVPTFLLLRDLGSSPGYRHVKICGFSSRYRTIRALIKTRISERRNKIDEDTSYREEKVEKTVSSTWRGILEQCEPSQKQRQKFIHSAHESEHPGGG